MCLHHKSSFAILFTADDFSGSFITLMEHFMKTMIRLFKNEDGATAIEYGLLAALISVAIIGAVALIGTNLNTTFGTVATTLR